MRLSLSRLTGRRLAVITAGAVVVAGAAVVPALPAFAATACSVTYQATPWTESPTTGGYTANITINNTGDAWSSWTLAFALPSGQSFTNGWSANWSGSTSLTATNMSWNGNVPSGGNVVIGFNGRWTGSYSSPTTFTVNGATCGGSAPPTTPPVTTPPVQVPGTPGNLSASGTTADSTNLTWTASSGTVTNYQVERCQGVSCYNFAQIATTTTTSYAATGLSASTTYRFRVRATNSAGTSGYSNIVTVTTSSTPPPPTSPPPPGQKVDNPYAGADVYVNPQWRAKAQAEPGGSRIANQPTGVWLDSIGSIEGNDSATTGTMGLADHLDEALAQDSANGSRPLVFQVVIYDLPGRDCSALASNGELGVDELPRYKAEYIDPIRAIMSQSKYANLRIVAVIEIDSLPNLVTNLNVPTCATMNSNGGYVRGVGYALAQLGSLSNVYNYIDAAHHAWIGWDSNFLPSIQKMKEAATAEGSNVNYVNGFITNTANYSVLDEPYIDINGTIGGQQIKSSSWFDWNPYEGELSFAQSFRSRAISEGFPSNIGMLIDTSRNGWGGPARPSGPSSSTDLNTFVDESRLDRRIHAGNWCNQDGAGLGARPQASPASGIDAYVWIKPPGESDGSSTEIPNDEGKGFDRMCDPTYTGNERNGYNLTGALPNAPLSGHWFSAQFQQLMANAYPPLS